VQMLGLARGGGRGGRGRSGRRGRGGRGHGHVGVRDAADDMVYLAENADGERLEKRFGTDKMTILEQAFDEVADNVLPHPMEDAYMDACHTNNMVRVALQWTLQDCLIWVCL
jgi:hypothetical protein